MKTAKGADKQRLNLSIESTLARRAGAYSEWIGEDLSSIFARLMRAEMRGFTVTLRRDAGATDPAEAGPIRLADREAG